MKPEAARALRTSVENLLAQAVSLYSQVLMADNQEAPSQVRLQRLFTATTETPRESALIAYEPVVPHVRFGYQQDSKLTARLTETKPAHAIGRPGAQNRLTIFLDEPDTSRFFTLELAMSWPEVRAAKTVELTLVGQADLPLEVAPRLRVFQKKGDWLDVATSRVIVETETKVLTADLNVALPHASFLDFEREPTLLLFFELRPFRLELDQLLLKFA